MPSSSSSSSNATAGGGGGEPVVELTIDETQALRSKLGLPPLRLRRHRGGAIVAADREDAVGGEGGGVGGGGEEVLLSLSIDETNALRVKIGLPPLRIAEAEEEGGGGGGGGGSSSSSSSSANFVHAPAPDTSRADSVRRRLEDASARREAGERFRRLEAETAAEMEREEEEGGGGGGSALDFAARMRSGARPTPPVAAGGAPDIEGVARPVTLPFGIHDGPHTRRPSPPPWMCATLNRNAPVDTVR
jgi:hypothetical protein